MSSTNRTAAIVAICSMLATSYAPPAAASHYPDVPHGQWFADYVHYLSENNVVSGYPNNQFRPHNDVTRAEFATMMAKSQQLPVGAAGTTKFSDVPGSHWASAAINAVSSRGWIAGYPNGTFGPNQPITMAEMYTIVSKVAPSGESDAAILNEFTDGSSIPSWAQEPVASTVTQGIYVSEVTPNQIEPFVHASRADVSTTLAKLMNASFRTPVVASTPEPDDQPGRRVVSRGVLIQEDGDWAIRTEDGATYFVGDEFNFSQFDVGDMVNFVGFPIPGSRRNIIRLVELIPVPRATPPRRPSPSPRVITVDGVLKRTVEAGGWLLVEQRTGRNYRLESIGNYQNRPWFKEGTRVNVEGRVVRDRPNIYMQGTPLRVIRMQPRDTRPNPRPRPGAEINQ